MSDEKYIFTAGAKKNLIIILGVGVVLSILGVVLMNVGGHHGGHEEAAQGEHAFSWVQRLYANLWINNVFFTGLAIIGVFFVAIQYVAQAGWSAGIMRIPIAFGNWLPIAGIMMLVLFFFGGHDLFHWTHHDLYDTASEHYDSILDGKKAYFFWPLTEHPNIPVFYYLRMVIFFGLWIWLFRSIKAKMYSEDIEGGTKVWKNLVAKSAVFLVVFAVTSSIGAWDWVMSIDPHWFSTMFGWYVFASWWVSGLALMTFIVVMLKDRGYLSVINSNHIHDLGKFLFAFSIFWTYIWFSQFLLIYYANIPEETIYFVERMMSDHYSPYFFGNLLINFCLPFLLLMTRDAKRHTRMLKVVCPIIIFGHWIDFYLMITPGTLKDNGGMGFLEIGLLMVYTAAFLYVVLSNLAKQPLVAKNHPMLEESLHHHV